MRSVRQWLLDQRTSVRLAFILNVIAMGTNALLSLLWTRALLKVLGDSTYGLFLSFLGVTRLGGLGDLGVTGAVAIRSGQAIGRGDIDWLRSFLPAARALSLVVILLLSLAFLVTSPWLPGWLGFKEEPKSGSLTMLFATAAPAVAIYLAGGYFNAINHANGTVTWPVIPALLVTQLGLAGQWIAASAGAPLWVQHSIVAAMFAVGVGISWRMAKVPHAWLGDILPLRFDFAVWRDLATTSGWLYLYGLGNAVYWTTDRLLINAGFGAGAVPAYLFNLKLCELALQLIVSAGSVGLPKITRWISSPQNEDRERAITEIRRLGAFQAMLGAFAATIYLLINDWFVMIWVGDGFSVPRLWQLAFAMNLIVTAGSAAATQTAGLCGARWLRIASLSVGATALLNLGLSFMAMRLGEIAGIAFATVLAQVVLGICMTYVTSHHLGVPFISWAAKTCLLPVVVITAIYGVQATASQWGPYGLVLSLAGIGIVLLGYAKLIGVNRSLFAHEWRIFSAMLKSRFPDRPN